MEEVYNIPCIDGPHIRHGDHNTGDCQPGIDLPAHLRDGPHELFKAFEGQLVSLRRDKDLASGGQCVDGQHTQGGAAVQENDVILFLDATQALPQDGLPAHGVYQGDLHAGEFNICGEQVNPLQMVEDA